MKKYSSPLGDRIEELGLQYADIADACGVTVSCVSRWVSGDIKSMRIDKAIPLCTILRMDLESFIQMAEYEGYERKLDRLIQNYNKLNDDGKDRLVEYSEMLEMNYGKKIIQIRKWLSE